MQLVQIVAILGSAFYLGIILFLVFNRKIHEEYAIIWIFFGFILLLFSVWRKGLEYISRLLGIHYPPSALLLILVGSVILILIQFSIVISKLTKNVIELTQELGITRHELEVLKEKLEKEKK